MSLQDDLRRVPLFAAWADKPEGQEATSRLSRDGEEVCLAAGDQLFRENDSPNFYIVLDGEVRITKRQGDVELLMTTWGPGVFFGELPIILGVPTPANGYAIKPTRLLRLRPEAFWRMIGQCPVITQTVLRAMAERVRNLESASQDFNRLNALNTLAAGLAHELNNPASAARRAADEGEEAARRMREVARRLHQLPLAPECWEALERAACDAATRHRAAAPLAPMERAVREEELAEWCERYALDDGWRLAASLADCGITPEELQNLINHLPDAARPDSLRWLEAALTLDTLWSEARHSADRISSVVDSMRGYAYLDRAPQQEIDVHEGLENTLALMRAQLEGVTLVRDYDCTLPTLCAHGRALNQVWTNLIENAADALHGGGRLTIRTRRDGEQAFITFEDDGPGIPEEIRPHLFEPFFTTKSVGQGVGLGLVTCFRVVRAHGGTITFESEAGKGTRFEVRLPFTPVEPGKGI